MRYSAELNTPRHALEALSAILRRCDASVQFDSASDHRARSKAKKARTRPRRTVDLVCMPCSPSRRSRVQRFQRFVPALSSSTVLWPSDATRALRRVWMCSSISAARLSASRLSPLEHASGSRRWRSVRKAWHLVRKPRRGWERDSSAKTYWSRHQCASAFRGRAQQRAQRLLTARSASRRNAWR